MVLENGTGILFVAVRHFCRKLVKVHSAVSRRPSPSLLCLLVSLLGNQIKNITNARQLKIKKVTATEIHMKTIPEIKFIYFKEIRKF